MGDEYSSYRVLVADDQRMVAETLAEVIRCRLGCDTMSCGDGDAALEILESRPVDAFVTDMLMPGCHGIELIQQAKAIRPHCDIIVMTAYPAEFPYIAVVEAGASDFIIKPYPMEEICARLLSRFREQGRREKETIHEVESTQSDSGNGQSDRYVLLFENNMNGMVVVRNSDRKIEDVNQAFCEWYGGDRTMLLGHPIMGLVSENHSERLEVGLDVIATTGRGALAGLALQRSDATVGQVDISISFVEHNNEGLFLLACRDVTEQHHVQDRLIELANMDDLTGLLNRRVFNGRLASAMEWADQGSGPLSIALIDLDEFKHCNDTYGHQVGDTVLRQAGESIRKHIRNSDEGFRYGGDEFALVLRGADATVAARAAERIQNAFKEHPCYGVTMSIGIAQYRSGCSLTGLLREADAAMYAAKSSGRNAIHIVSDPL